MADLEAIALELAALRAESDASRRRSSRSARRCRRICRESRCGTNRNRRCAAAAAQLKRIGEDVSEKLDYTPGVFTVERHIRGKWACAHCQTLIQAPVPAQVIDKGMPTAGLLAQVLVAKYPGSPAAVPAGRRSSPAPAWRIPRSTLAQWVGACGVQLQPLVDALKPALLDAAGAACRRDAGGDARAGQRARRIGRTSGATARRSSTRSRPWSTTSPRAAPARMPRRSSASGRARWCAMTSPATRGCSRDGVTEAGCMAHARRKFHELWANHHSPLAEEALKFFRLLYDVERLGRELDAEQRRRLRQLQAKPIADTLREWLMLQRQRATDGTAIAKAIDYSLGRWEALTRYLADGTCRSTTTGSRIASGRSRSGDRTGCSPARCAPASARRQ